MRPGASGILLVSHQSALDMLPVLQGTCPDELALLCLGHVCPEPGDCAGRHNVPALHRDAGEAVLLAACLHNLGAKAVQASPQKNITISTTDQIC